MTLRLCSLSRILFILGACSLVTASAVAQEALQLTVPPDVESDSVAAATVDRLLDLMQERLELMHEVARWKWNYGLSVEDLVREQHILNVLVPRAAEHGVDEGLAQAFLQAQMDAAKAIQWADIALWEAEGVDYFQDVASLQASLRPRLVSLTYQILGELAQLDLANPKTAALLEEGIDQCVHRAEFAPEVYDLAFGPLRSAR